MPGKFLAEFEMYLMLAIARLGDDAYGAKVRQDIEARTGRPVSIGALYTSLARLEDKGLIAARTAQPDPSQRGRPRRYSRLTPRGREALRHSTEMLQRMMAGVTIAARPLK